MMSSFQTPQEEFWAGEFGAEYAARNASAELLARNIALFATVLRRAPGITSVIEFGASIGLNLRAIRAILPSVSLTGVEVNASAAEELRRIPGVTVHCQSLLDFDSSEQFDLTLSKGVLIHVNPDRLGVAYNRLYEQSRRYICIAEYYNATPVSVSYRGYEERLFKRDFAGEMLDRYSDLRLVDYGFVYRRDRAFPQDDVTWFLLER
jgi:pseudaminic acid biosynthesis-associated methylase